MRHILRKLEGLLLYGFDRYPEKLHSRIAYIKLTCFPVRIYRILKRFTHQTSSAETESNKAFVEMAHKTINPEIPKDASTESVLVKYSGGSDSTLCAATMAQHFKTVHLVTFNTNNKKIENISADAPRLKRNVQKLRKVFGEDKIKHTFLRIWETRDKVYFHHYLPHFKNCRDFRKVIICPSCVMAMNLESAVYCRNHGVKYVTDGSNVETGITAYQSQNPFALQFVSRMFETFGLAYLVNPNYFDPESDKRLFEMGVFESSNIKRSFRSRYLQQGCSLTMMFSMTSRLHGERVGLLDTAVDRDCDMISTVFKKSVPAFRSYINNRCADSL